EGLFHSRALAQDQVFESTVVCLFSRRGRYLDGLRRGSVNEQALFVHAALREPVQILGLDLRDALRWNHQLVARNAPGGRLTPAEAEVQDSVVVFRRGDEPHLGIRIGPVFVAARQCGSTVESTKDRASQAGRGGDRQERENKGQCSEQFHDVLPGVCEKVIS